MIQKRWLLFLVMKEESMKLIKLAKLRLNLMRIPNGIMVNMKLLIVMTIRLTVKQFIFIKL